MAKDFEDKFFEELRGGVIGNNSEREELIKRKDELEKAITEMESNVIIDPRMLEKLKKELAAINKKISEQEMDKAVEEGSIIAGTEETDKASVEEEAEKVNAEESPEDMEKHLEEEAQFKQAYYDAMMALHLKRMETISKQTQGGKIIFVSSREDFEIELELEAQMYSARDNYMTLGKEDPYRELRTELIRKEKEAREPIERELREKARKYKLLEEELKKLDKEQSEIDEKLLDENITDVQRESLQKDAEELVTKRRDIEVKLATIKKDLDPAIEERRARTIARAGLEEKFVETLTEEDKKNYDYQKSKVDRMNSNFDKAKSLEYNNIKRRIEEREEKIKRINKELKDMSPTDFERRLSLLNELDKETNMLEADREAKSDLDRGIEHTEQEMKKTAEEKVEREEDRQKEFDKATDDTRALIEEQKEKLGEVVVAHPAEVNEDERDRDRTLKAATVATVYDNPRPGPDTLLEDAAQYQVAKCVIAGLEDQVRDPNNPEDAKAMVEHDKQLREANKELDRVQTELQQNM